MTADELYKTVCLPRGEAQDRELKEIKSLAKKTHKAICESNGKPSVLSRLDSLETEKPKTKTIFGFPVESRDLPRIIGAAGIVALVLERFGALAPLIDALAER